MKQQRFLKGLAWLLALNLAIKPLWIFLIDREVQVRLGYAVYGGYFALLNLTTVLLFVADAGLSNLLVQQVATTGQRSAQHLLRLKLLLLLAYVAVCAVIGWISGITAWQLLAFLVCIQALGSLFLFLRGWLAATQRFAADAWFSVLDRTLLLLVCGALLYGSWQPFTLGIFLQLQLGTLLVANGCLLAYMWRKRLLTVSDKASQKPIGWGLLPFAAIILLMGAHYRLDGFLLERLRPDGALQAGLYATAYRLLDAANMPGYLTASFLVAYVARQQSNPGAVRSTVAVLQNLLLTAAIGAACFAAVFAAWIQQSLYHTALPVNNRLIALCLAVLPAYYLTHLYGSVLTATGELRRFLRVLALSVALNVFLNLVLIPVHGAIGSSVAALASQYVCAAGCYRTATRWLAPPVSRTVWLVYVAGGLLWAAALLLLKSLVQPVWVILASLALGAALLLLVQRKRLRAVYQSLTQSTHA